MRLFHAPLAALLCLVSPVFSSQFAFTEVMYNPPAGKPEFIELTNLTSNRIDSAKWRLTGGVEYTFPDFNPGAVAAHFLKEYERVVLSSGTEAATRAAYPSLPPNVRVFGPWTGSLNNDGETITVVDFANALQTTLTYGDRGNWSPAADGAGHSLQLINQDRQVDDWRNWRASKFAGGTPGAVEPLVAEEPVGSPEISVGTVYTVTQFNDVPGTGPLNANVPAPANPGDTQWKFYNGFAAPATDWRQPGFTETGWGGPGHAPLGTENAASPFIGIRTQVPQNVGGAVVTYYYRSTFNWTGPLTGNSFALDQVVDDGVIYYLNGQEIGRDRMPNPEGHGSLADPTAVGDATLESNKVGGGPALLDGKLVAGTNSIAASVHQNASGSSDNVFAARLKIITAAPPGVTINEVKPGATGAGFVEFYNPTASPVDLNGWYLSDIPGNLTKFQITTSLVVPALGFATIGYAESNLGLASPVAVILTHPDGTTRQAYVSSGMAIDGRSTGRKPVGSANWFLFLTPTPGADNFSAASGDQSPLRLSEAHFNAAGNVDWVEIQNVSTGAVNVSSMYISSRSDFADRVAFAGTLAGGAYASASVNFAAGSDVTLYLTDAANNVLATAEVERIPGLPSVQAWPSGASEWYAAATDTRDAANNPARSTDIVINEIMYDPPSKHTQGEYIELVNRGAAPVILTGWSLTKGLDYDFPAGTSIAPGEFIVVAKDPAFITATYGAGVRVFGPADGRLGNSGDLIRLEDANNNTADIVDYKDGGNWAALAAGGGSSLELLHPDMDNSEASSWRASDESNKSTFQTFTHAGTYKQLRGAPTAESAYDELMLNLVSDGHIVMKSISLTRSAAPGTNQIPNGDATSHGTGNSSNGFFCTGTHRLSDTVGGEFHLISSGSGDTKGNKAEVDVIGIANGDQLSFSFQGRWISGMPLLVMQTWDRSYGKVFRLPVPNNLGTPGAVNSTAFAAAAPSIDGLRHSPVVPTSTQSVVVSARVKSATALSTVSLLERVDTVAGNGAWTTLPMNDSGTGGDAAAGDGIWSATVAPRADGTITQFYVRATAVNGQLNECPRDGAGVNRVNGSVLEIPGRPAMWIVDNSPPSSQPGLLVERYIFSLYHRNAMNTGTGFSSAYDWDFPEASNFGLNATMILNESDVIYNCELRKGGSPWTRNGGNSMERARWRAPGDNLFRGRARFAIDSDGSATNTAARFHNRMARYMMYLFGYPVPDAEFVQQIVNGDSPSWRDDMELTDSEFFERAYGEGGELFEIDDAWYMYDDFDNRIPADSVTGRWSLLDWTNNVALGTNPSAESPIFYHGNWPLRFPESGYDFASLASIMKTAFNNNSGVIAAQETTFRDQMERQIDTDRAAIYAAVRGYIGDWDNFTMDRGKNGYFYRRPADGKFEFHHWDSDLAYDNSSRGFIGSVGGLGWSNYVNRPWFRQRFNFYLTELVTKYTRNSARMQAWLDAMNYQSANSHANAPFKTAAYNYPTTWFTPRETPALNFIGANLNRVFAISTPNNQTVATPVFTIGGAVSSRARTVDIAGHPEAVCTFVPVSTSDTGGWTLTNIALGTGLNALTVRAIDSAGAILSTLPFNVTLSINAPPVAVMTSDPVSRRIAANEEIVLDATGSFDPEGTALTFGWAITPNTGVTVAHSVPGKTEAQFSVPGTYTVAVTVTDAAANNTVLSRDITVFNSNDFAPFADGESLGPQFTVQNVEVRDNFSASSWYSVEDQTGRLMIQLLDDIAKPMASPAFTHPLITRDLPDTSDFILQTDLEQDTREFGDWQSGLWLEMIEGGSAVRYALSLEGGINVTVKRAVQPGAWTQVATAAVTGSGATLRIHRTGDSLVFQRLSGNAWVTAFTQAIPAGSAASTGGVFVASTIATSVRISFDYLLVSDPTATSSVLASLRVTEIMYNPDGPGGVEFIELTNAGALPIELGGVYFEAGRPFDQFTFPAYTMAPGSFVVVTNVTLAEFATAYPATPAGTVFQWPAGGNLSNGGERITLRDPFGNIIQDFTFDDDPLTNWPQPPDGGGFSLEVVSTSGNYDSAANWTSGAESSGTPGWLGAGPDSDNDGFSDRMEQLAGTGAGDGSNFFNVTSQPVATGQKVTWPSYPGRTYHVETSPTMAPASWVRRASIPHPTGNPAGTGEYTVTNPSPLNTARQYYRIVVELTP